MTKKSVNEVASDSKKSVTVNIEKAVVKYEKPRILFRQKLEAAAAVCDPNSSGKEDTLVCAFAGS